MYLYYNPEKLNQEETFMTPKFDYVRPDSLAHAIDLLNDPAYQNRPLAGGSDILVHLHHYPPAFNRLVDISLLPELKVIKHEGNLITLGAGVTFGEVVESQSLSLTTPFLVKACRAVGSPQIRNTGTVGGNVVNAAACADSLPVLVCLDAVAHLRGPQGERSVGVSQLVMGPNRTQLKPGELLTHFTFETPPANVRTTFHKVGRRNAQAISRLTMAAMGRVDDSGIVDFVRITPGAATPQTSRFTEAENLLLGEVVTDDLIVAAANQVAVSMIDITGRRWSTEYKEPVIAALAERALREVLSTT